MCVEMKGNMLCKNVLVVVVVVCCGSSSRFSSWLLSKYRIYILLLIKISL